MALAAFAPAFASDFLDTGVPDKAISFGVRFGLNSTGQSTSLKGYSDNVSHNRGTGFIIGGVVDLNIRQFFSVQPGFFFENRSYDYTVVRYDQAQQSLQNDLGHTRSNSFTLPVLASFKFQLSHTVRWNVDIGPYFGFGLGGSDDREIIGLKVASNPSEVSKYEHFVVDGDYYGNGQWRHRKFDWGVKIGTGLRLSDHYVFNVYYMGGLKNVSDYGAWSMKSRSWNFSIGYDF